MLKLSKLTDYGIVLMGYMARQPDDSRAARELAEVSGLPLPTVSKVLKSLSRGGLLVSHRGKRGGYSLALAPEDISVAEMIRVLEGPVALTECSSAHIPTLCEMEAKCPVRGNWQVINEVVFKALKGFSLAQMLEQQTSCEATSTSTGLRKSPLLELVKS